MEEVFRPLADGIQTNLDKIIRLHQYTHDPDKYYVGQQREAEDHRERLRQERIIRENKFIKPELELPQVLELINAGQYTTDPYDREFQRVSLFYLTQLERMKHGLAQKEAEARLPQSLYAIQRQQAELISIEAMIRTMLEDGVRGVRKAREQMQEQFQKYKNDRQAEFYDRYAALKRVQQQYEYAFHSDIEDAPEGLQSHVVDVQLLDNNETAWGEPDPPDTPLERQALAGKLFGDYAFEQFRQCSDHLLPIRAPESLIRALQFNTYIYKYKNLAFVPPSGFNQKIFDLKYTVGAVISKKQLQWKRRLSVIEINLIYGLITAITHLFPGVVYVKQKNQSQYLKIEKLYAIQSRRLDRALGISMKCIYDRLTRERYLFTLAIPFRHGRPTFLPYGDRVDKGKFAIDDQRTLEVLNDVIQEIRSAVLI